MTPTKKKRPRRNICPRCDQPTGKASAVHTCKPKLQLTDRMKAQGVVKTCWYTTDLCGLCGGQMATNGQTRWCVSRMHA